VNSNGIDQGIITWTPSAADVGRAFSYNSEFQTVMTSTITVVEGSVSLPCTPALVHATSHTFTVRNVLATSYTIDACASNPVLQLTAGQTYTFRVTAPGHPFWLKTVNGPGINNGITGVIGQNATSADVVWTPQATDAGQAFFYNCEFHARMNGTINVVGGGSTTPPSSPAPCGSLTLTSGSTTTVTNVGLASYTFGTCTANPTLVVTAQNTYTFSMNAAGHPFWIRTVQGVGRANAAAGVTSNGVDAGSIQWTPTCADAGKTLFYNCEFHSAMTNTITVLVGACPPSSSSSYSGLCPLREPWTSHCLGTGGIAAAVKKLEIYLKSLVTE